MSFVPCHCWVLDFRWHAQANFTAHGVVFVALLGTLEEYCTLIDLFTLSKKMPHQNSILYAPHIEV